MAEGSAPVLILGAGYAGATLAQLLARRERVRPPIVLVGRHDVQVLRTELYQIGRLAARGEDVRHWAIPIGRIVRAGSPVEFRLGEVGSIDLEAREVSISGRRVPYRALAICLGSVPAYYGVPGAAEHLHQVYGLAAAMRLARALRAARPDARDRPTGGRVRVVVVGGGSTGVEVAAEIATTDWARLGHPSDRRIEVVLVCGAQPLLAGLPAPLVARARRLLDEAGVLLDEGRNVTEVLRDELRLQDGGVLRFDLGIWTAGIEAPPAVRALPGPHGRAGRVVVEPTLQLPGHPEAFALGDVVEHRAALTGQATPQTAQAALEEARWTAGNLARWEAGEPLRPFRFRGRGTIVSVGRARASAQVGDVTVWGRPAAVLKSLVEAEYRAAAQDRGRRR